MATDTLQTTRPRTPQTVTVRGQVRTVKLLLRESTIQARVRGAARFVDDLDRPYGPPVLICVERGAKPLYHDLTRRLRRPFERRSLRYASYEGDQSGKGEWLKEPGNLTGRHVLLVEDIVDTGKAITAMVERCYQLGAARVDVIALLHKPTNDRSGLQLAWVGFVIGPEFVIGYGLDYNGRYRRLRDICQVLPRVSTAPPAVPRSAVRRVPVQSGPQGQGEGHGQQATVPSR